MAVMSPKGNPVASNKANSSIGVVIIQSMYRVYQIARVPSRRMVVRTGVFPKLLAKAK